MSPAFGSKSHDSQKLFVALCIFPVLMFLLIVSVIPTIVTISNSLTAFSLSDLTKRGAFIGLENYRDLLSNDPNFYGAIWRTILFVVVVVPIEFALGLCVALWLNRQFIGKRIVLTLIMIPTMTAPVVVGMIWRFLLMPSFGVVSVYLSDIGLFRETSIFSQPVSAFVALMIVDVWQWTPFIMLILLAGLTAMPKSPIEAATLDGATRWQILRHIELPLLRPLIIIALMLRTIDASKVFDTVYLLTGGGPGSATEVISTFAYRVNFSSWNLGYGAAICLVLAYASLVGAALFFKIVNLQAERNSPNMGNADSNEDVAVSGKIAK